MVRKAWKWWGKGSLTLWCVGCLQKAELGYEVRLPLQRDSNPVNVGGVLQLLALFGDGMGFSGKSQGSGNREGNLRGSGSIFYPE